VTWTLRFAFVVRTLDPGIDGAIAAATLVLLNEHGFARLTIEAVAKSAGVRRPGHRPAVAHGRI
jgi:hypothetical protein